MPALHAIHGRIVDLRRYTNVHLYWRRHFGPTDRYELWMRDRAGRERKFTINTRTLPARRGHDVTLIVTEMANAAQVLGMINASTGNAVNYARTDPPVLLRARDFLVQPMAFVVLVMWLGDLGLLLFLPIMVAYFLAVSVVRGITRAGHMRSVDRVLATEQTKSSVDKSSMQR